MKLRSLGYSTDVMLAGFDGEVLEREGYLAVVTPSSPRFWWGNFVLFAHPPRAGDLEPWMEIFAGEIGRRPGIRHVSLAWDSPDGATGDLEAFLAAGFDSARTVSMTASAPQRPPHHDDHIEVRPIRGGTEWARALDLQLCCPLEGVDPGALWVFHGDQFRRYRRLVSAGHGAWFGAFIDGRLAGSMGLFGKDGLYRCQAVATLPDFRRRGVCSTLVHEVCRYGFDELGARTIVMHADPEGSAVRIYRAAGFEDRETLVSIARRARSESA